MRDRDLAVHDVLFTGIDRALRQIAASTPAELDRFLGPLLEAAVADLRFLACRALTVAARPDDAIEWLLGDPRNLELGWSGDRDASRDLIETCSNTCNDGVYATLERTLLSYTPHWETLPDRQRFLGFSQYELLSRLDEDRRSSATIVRLQELDRQFPGGPPKALRQPNDVTAVRSPIPDETIITMSDDEWRDALRKYADAGLTLHDHPVVGAIGALTQSLHERSKHEPERFARFVLTLDAGYPAAATDAVIRAVGGGVIPVELLATLCEHAHAMHGSELDRTICHTIQQTKETTSTLVNLLTDIARDPDPATNELSRTMTGPGIDGLLNDGVNTTRGAAALAIANVIYRQPDHVDTLLPVVRTLAQDPHLGVRSCAADAVSALLNHRPHDALDLALMLLEPDITVLGARTSEQLLIYATVRDRDRFAPIITTGLQAGEPVATRAGRVWAVAALNDALSQQLPDSVTGLNAHARRGAAEILAMHPSHVADELAVLFNDDDADVRSAAARAMRALDTVPPTDRDDFVTSFIHSTSFAEQPDDLLDTLDEAPHLTSIAAFEGCEKLVAIAGPALGDLTSRHGRYGPTITNITLRLYREGNPELRTRCLNLFDRLVEHNALAIGDLLDDDR